MHQSGILTVALFGEAEKGEYNFPYFFETLPQLVDYLGHPPEDSRGLFYAVQTLLFHRNLIYFRVKQEGFSYSDYFSGLRLLSNRDHFTISAICAPGVGSMEIIDAAVPICKIHHSIFITNESDFYDYLMENSS